MSAGTPLSAGELRSHALSDLVGVAPFDLAVGPGEVDVFEDAEPASFGREGLERARAVPVDDDHFARFDVAHETRPQDVERAGLRGQHVGAVEVAQDQRTHPQGVAYADERVVGEGDERIGAHHPPERVDEAAGHVVGVGQRHEMHDDLRVGGRLEDRAAPDQIPAHRMGVGQVAVVRQREAAHAGLHEDRLHVAQHGRAGGGVTVVADRRATLQPLHDRVAGEHVRNQPQVAVDVELRAVEGHDSGGFLTPVLQGVEAQGGVGRGVPRSEDAEDAAFLARPGVVGGMAEREARHARRPRVTGRLRSGRRARNGRGRYSLPRPNCQFRALPARDRRDPRNRRRGRRASRTYP